jgi:hypothetical protein
MSDIAFTGSQEGPVSKLQERAFTRLIRSRTISIWRHGDCIGWDEFAHNIIVRLYGEKVKVIIHPPDNDEKRAFCKAPNMELMLPKPYLDRDDDMAKICKALVACPKGDVEELRSGTWATVRYAKSYHKPVYLVFPSGRVDRIGTDGRRNIVYHTEK